jgi:hypothetical protein
MQFERKWFHDREFYQDVTYAVFAIYEILVRAELLTPDVMHYLAGAVIKPTDGLSNAAAATHCRKRTITLNRRFLKKYPQHLQGVLLHEVLHLIDYRVNGHEDHGPSWQRLMVRCGLQPNAELHI